MRNYIIITFDIDSKQNTAATDYNDFVLGQLIRAQQQTRVCAHTCALGSGSCQIDGVIV